MSAVKNINLWQNKIKMFWSWYVFTTNIIKPFIQGPNYEINVKIINISLVFYLPWAASCFSSFDINSGFRWLICWRPDWDGADVWLINLICGMLVRALLILLRFVQFDKNLRLVELPKRLHAIDVYIYFIKMFFKNFLVYFVMTSFILIN